MGRVVGPILGTVILAAQNPAGVPVRVDSTVLAAGLDSDGVPRNILVDANGNILSTGGAQLGTTPSTQAFGDAASAGASTLAAPELHKHGMPVGWSQGTHAARPAASSSLNGNGYYETDTGRQFVCLAATWVQIGINPNVLSGSLQASGDTTGFSNSTFKDVSNLSQSLVAGSYLINAGLTVLDATPTGGNACVVIWDGSTVYGAEDESLFSATGAYYGFGVVSKLIVLGSTTTIKVSARFTAASGKSVSQNPDSLGISPTMSWTAIA